jgi:hypothetical protein
MTRRLPKKDVVVVGLGWTGSILAHELCLAGLDVVALERGPWRDTATDFNIGTAPDELRYAVRQDIFLRPAQETLTVRNKPDQLALPIRKWGSFLPGNGVGGAGVHWNGQTWRFLPEDFILNSHLTQRYGEGLLPENHMIQDWGVTYQELEPYYDRFEKIAGISGKAGNLNGQKQDGGNFFEGPRSAEYPTPAMTQGYAQQLFTDAAKRMNLHPFPRPSANLSAAYTNPYGMRMAPCTYCGFCEWFGCANYSKSSPQTCVLPALMRQPNFSLRTLAQVTKINLTPDRKHATGVTYVDAQGRGDRAAGRPRAGLRLRAVQRAAAAALRHRPALRPCHGRGRGGQELRLSEQRQRHGLFRRRRADQPLRRRRLARRRAGRLQRRQFRPCAARLRGRRLDHLRPYQWPPDQLPAGAAGHAALGLGLEEGESRRPTTTSPPSAPGQRDELSRQLSGPRSHLQGSPRPAADADDLRLQAERG